ncbi:hypothetical protein H0H92_009027, partial [Tricholoma furcatifolium]
MAWIVPILHVCSHWREAALSTPSLWSTIHVEFPGALQMLDRSKGVALSVISYDEMPRKAFDVLDQVLASPLHHIKDFLVRQPHHAYDLDPWGNNHTPLISRRELLDLLAGHHSSLKRVERFQMIHPMPIGNKKLPDGIVAASCSLKHLTINGFGLNWGLLHTFNNLKTFIISSIPDSLRPSM